MWTRAPSSTWSAPDGAAVNQRDIKALIKLVEESGIDELEVSRWGRSVRIVKRSANGAEPDVSAGVGGLAGGASHAIPASPPPPASVAASGASTAPTDGAGRGRPGIEIVRAPMVGTLYRAPSPEAPAYVDVGDRVRKGQTLCILEAMKLMNEVKAEVEGVVRAIHVPNAEPVEFGQLLFELEPLAGRPLDAV